MCVNYYIHLTGKISSKSELIVDASLDFKSLVSRCQKKIRLGRKWEEIGIHSIRETSRKVEEKNYLKFFNQPNFLIRSDLRFKDFFSTFILFLLPSLIFAKVFIPISTSFGTFLSNEFYIRIEKHFYPSI